MTTTLRGKTINGGVVEAEAIVSNLPFSFLGDLEVSTGRIMVPGHDLEGQTIAGKVFVFPTGKGSTAGPNAAFAAKRLGNLPIGLILEEAEPVIAMVAIMNGIPAVHRLSESPLKAIRTGDRVLLDADRGVVEVLPRQAGQSARAHQAR